MFHIYRDGAHVGTVGTEEALVRWFHSHHPYSMHHAVTWEGYSVLDSDFQEVAV